jgi:hypothetical protein
VTGSSTPEMTTLGGGGEAGAGTGVVGLGVVELQQRRSSTDIRGYHARVTGCTNMAGECVAHVWM